MLKLLKVIRLSVLAVVFSRHLFAMVTDVVYDKK